MISSNKYTKVMFDNKGADYEYKIDEIDAFCLKKEI